MHRVQSDCENCFFTLNSNMGWTNDGGGNSEKLKFTISVARSSISFNLTVSFKDFVYRKFSYTSVFNKHLPVNTKLLQLQSTEQ